MKCGDLNNPGGQGLTSKGDPCRRETIPGGTRCALHGGATPTAKIKAEQALALLRMPAIEALYDVLDQLDSNPCMTCGYPVNSLDEKKLRVHTAKAVLDRTGMGPRSTIELTKQSDGDLNLNLLTPDEREQLLGIYVQAQAIKSAVRSRQRMTGDDANTMPLSPTVQ